VLGIYNREISRKLPPDALTVADNVDIDEAGSAVRREGYSKVFSLSQTTSAFITHDERRLFLVAAGRLYLVVADLLPVELAQGLSSKPIQWVEMADYVLLSTGEMISLDNKVSTWVIPSPPPVDLRQVSGQLEGGQYQVVCTYIDPTGREGAASEVSVIEVTRPKAGIEVSVPSLEGFETKVYVTDTNGSEHYFYAQMQNGSIVVNSMEEGAIPIDPAQLTCSSIPFAVDSLGVFEGSLVASHFSEGVSTVLFSKPFWWNLFDLESDFISVPGKVKKLYGTPQGLLIATDDEIYAYTAEEVLVRLAEYGAPSGEPFTRLDSGQVYFWTNQGLCSVFPFKNHTESKLSVPPGAVCSAALVEQHGQRKIISLTDGRGHADNKLF